MVTKPTFEALSRQLVPLLVPFDTPGSIPYVPGHLSIGLARGTAAGVHTVSHEQLAEWGLSFSRALHLAMENQRDMSDPSHWLPVETMPGLKVYPSGAGPAASRVLFLDELIEPWPTEGVLFVAPSPRHLLVAPVNHLGDLSTSSLLLQAARHAMEQSEHPVTDQLFWHDGERIHHLPVVEEEDRVEIQPPEALSEAVERLTALAYVAEAAEA